MRTERMVVLPGGIMAYETESTVSIFGETQVSYSYKALDGSEIDPRPYARDYWGRIENIEEAGINMNNELTKLNQSINEALQSVFNEEYVDTIERDKISNFLVKQGWTGDKHLEVFKLPASSADLKGLKEIRMGVVSLEDIYFWDARILHYVLAQVSKLTFSATLIYELGSDTLISSDSKQMVQQQLDNMKYFEDGYIAVFKKIIENFPRIKKFETCLGTFEFDELFKEKKDPWNELD